MTSSLSRRAYAVILFLILVVCYGYFLPKWADWGANSRANLVYAVGDKGVLYIDDYHTNTGDLACYPGPYTPAANPEDKTGGSCEGHFYTDKSIGPSLLALPFYIVFKGVAALPPVQNLISNAGSLGSMADTLNPDGQGAQPQAVYEYMALTFITFFASAVPSAFLAVVIFFFACRFANKDSYAFVLALAYGLGTMAFPYSNALYQHQLASVGTFLGFFLLWRVVYEQANVAWLWLVGVLFSFVVITEYPVVPMLGVIFLWALYKIPNRIALYRVVLAAIPLGLLFAAYNYAIFQTPLPAGYEYSTNWQGEHQTGFFSLVLPTADRLYGLTFSPVRGIFVMSPFLLLSFGGFYLMWKERRDQRSTWLMFLFVIAGFFFYNSASEMWWGGFTVGPRYLVPMLPFVTIPIIFAFNRLFVHLGGRLVGALLVLASIFSVAIMTIGGQGWPPVNEWPLTINQMNASFPLVDYSLPLVIEGNVARNYGMFVGLKGLFSLIPLLVVVGVLLSLLLGLLRRSTRQTNFSASKLKIAREA